MLYSLGNKENMTFLDFAKSKLQSNGYRLTKARKTVLKSLSESIAPLNAYEIGKIVNNTVDISTIYRILAVLEKENLIHRMNNQKYVCCKEIFCSDCNHCHHQFSCEKCSSVEEIHIEDKSFIQLIQKKYPHLNVQNHSFEFSGLCQSCQ